MGAGRENFETENDFGDDTEGPLASVEDGKEVEDATVVAFNVF